MTTDAAGVLIKTQGVPLSSIILSFKANRVHRSPVLRRFVDEIDHRNGQQFVRNGEIEADKLHRFCAGDSSGQIVRVNIKSEITPIQAKGCQSCVLHCR